MGVGYAASKTFSMLISFLYPAYRSYKAIKTEEKDDDTEWVNWTIAGFFTVVEYFADFIISWLPFYFELKVLFLIWLQLPSFFNGANLMWRFFIEPILDKYADWIDKYLLFGVRSLTNVSLAEIREAQRKEKEDKKEN
ncbi:receptor expression-enhancing protein [Anaeramoeba ignava]|uniref:Receptor expression-enhancing protein n=1 Tax=Anaeramoeba ignava TaxID=1746090 RepID=A0A9Q0R4R4_ANAIG|nr:receptor expression-enhancing protein [Anaeramoeba ignava]